MLHLIYGCPGSGKSRLLSKMIASRLRAGADVIYLVPERFSVLAEEEVTAVCRGLNLMNLDVLSFKRLCNRAFREYGGICYNYAGRGGQILIMLRAREDDKTVAVVDASGIVMPFLKGAPVMEQLVRYEGFPNHPADTLQLSV